MTRTQGEIIADMRRAAGSRAKLAAEVDVSTTTAQGWERFGREPSARPLARLVRAHPELGQELLDILAVDAAVNEIADDELPDA